MPNVLTTIATEDATLTDILRKKIEDDILTGTLQPGDKLDERSLSERYSVSRTPVREALLQLASTGIVTTRPRQGSIVTPLSMGKLIQMIEVMCFTEAQAAALAARRMSSTDRGALIDIQKTAKSVADSGEFAAFEDINWKLHNLIFKGCGNVFLGEQARLLRLRLHPYRGMLLRISGRIPIAHQEHEIIVQAIVAGDSTAAQTTMAAHLAIDASRLGDLAAILPADQDEPSSKAI